MTLDRLQALYRLLQGGLWKIFGVLLLFCVVLLLFGIVIAGIAGLVSVGPLVIVGSVLILVLIGVGAINDPTSIQRNILIVFKRIFSEIPDVFGRRAYQPTHGNGFDRLVRAADKESTELADLLRGVRAEYGDVSCDDIADLLALGIDTQDYPPWHQVLNQMKKILDSRDFVEQSDSLELRVIQRDGEVLYARLTDDHGQPKVGIEFDLYIEEAIQSDGEAEIWPKQVGTVEVALVESRFCGVEVVSWTEQFNVDAEERMEYIMTRNPTLRFNEEAISGVDWEDLERAYESLVEITTGGETTHAY